MFPFESPRHPAWSSCWKKFLVELDDFIFEPENSCIGRVKFTDLRHDDGGQVSLDEIELFLKRRLSMKVLDRNDRRVYFTPISPEAETRCIAIYCSHDEMNESE